MPSTLKLEVISPDAIVHQTEVSSFNVLSSVGWLGILPRHSEMIASLETCAAKLKFPDNHEELMAITGGFMEVRPDKITLLVTAAETPQMIDADRAQAAYDRAKERIAKFNHAPLKNEDIDVPRAELALKRAIARLKTVGKLPV